MNRSVILIVLGLAVLIPSYSYACSHHSRRPHFGPNPSRFRSGCPLETLNLQTLTSIVTWSDQ